MKIVFFGTPDYVVPILVALNKNYQIIAVVTQPPKVAGRGKEFKIYSAVDDWAHKKKVPIIFDFDEVPICDLGIVAAYGKIIPKSVIAKFKYGILNIHPSILPQYRGASPVQAAIAAGDNQTGVTIIKMDELMDHGPVVSQFKEPIEPQDTTASLRARLFARSVNFLIELIPNYLSGKIKPHEQDHAKATVTKILKKEDGFIDLAKTDPKVAERFIRAMAPWPGAWTYIEIDGQKKRLKILDKDTVQLEGKNPVPVSQFKKAYPFYAY